ncbi:MAG: hypothetical protein HZB55_21515 [Deltaproteobacteria bacterium]|nr:hypothetical protein [Deltaproteobacteria bacterium]
MSDRCIIAAQPIVPVSCRVLRVWLLLTLTLVLGFGAATAAPPADAPTISGISVDARADRFVVRYDLAAREPVGVALVGSTDGGRTYRLSIRSVEGDVGHPVPPGRGRTIEWAYRKDYPGGLGGTDLTLDVVPVGERYLTVPLHGRFGVELDEDLLRDCLRCVVAASATFVVLEIESPGGSVLEMEDMLDVLVEWKGDHPSVRVLALVRGEASHAAALFAAAAGDEVFLLPGASIGANGSAPPGGPEVLPRERDLPDGVREKVFTLAAKHGIDPTLLDALIRPQRVALALTPGAGRRVVAVPEGPVPPRHLLLSDGKRLARLTAADAVLAGYAVATVRDYEDLGRQLGRPGWVSTGDDAEKVAQAFRRQVEKTLADYENLADMLRDGLAQAEAPEGAASLDAQDAGEFLELVEDLQGLARVAPFIEARRDSDFPRGIAGLRAPFEALRTAAASTSAGAAASAAPTRRRGVTRAWHGFNRSAPSPSRS